MSIRVTNWVWARSESRNGARLVLLALADRADDEGCSWPSISDLAARTKLTDRAVRKSLANLIELGELEVDSGGGRHRTNRYRIIPKPGTTDRVTDEEPGTSDRVSGPETLNSVPETLNSATQNPEFCSGNPEQSSPEPSEPSGNRQGTTPQPPTEQTPADRMLTAWWEQYGRRTAQGRRSIRTAIDNALRNGIEDAELWSALERLGELSKPVTGGTLQFALAEIRAAPPASGVADVVPLRAPTGRQHQQQTNDMFDRAMERANRRMQEGT